MTDQLQYTVGRFTLKPFRQLLDGAVPVSIGRKALDLLSVLARAEGELVTKDELMTAVWPKVIVEDNAIQVHITALRKALGKDAALLATVHGLGYRLAVAPGPAAPRATLEANAAGLEASPKRTRIMPIVSAAVSILALFAASLWPVRDHLPWAPQPRASGARFAVLPFEVLGSDAGSRVFAEALNDRIISQLSVNHLQALPKTEGQALRGANAAQAVGRLGADLLLDGDIRNDGKTLNVSVHLQDAREHVVVWSAHFQGPNTATEALQADVAADVAQVAEWATRGRTGKVKLDATALAAFIAARESTVGVRGGGRRMALSYYQSVVAASPDFARGHSGIAIEDAFAALGEPPAEKERLHEDARREAKRALALDPGDGEAYTALEMSLPLHDWRQREALLLQGAAVDPTFEPGVMMEGRLLWVVGRGHDALPWLQSAHDLDPLHNGASWTLALNLMSEGRPADGRAVLRQMEAEWPDHSATKDARFWIGLLTAPIGDSLAILADPAARPIAMNQKSVDAWRAALKASATHDRRARTDAARSVLAAATGGSMSHGQALTLLTMLGDLDDAFAQAQLYEPLDPYTAPYLFLPPTAPLRADPRFIPLAGKLGFVAYWRSTGQWPDFCSEPGLPYDCRREAAKVGVGR